MKSLTVLLLAILCTSSYARHYDWPMWRYNHGRSAATPEQLAGKLYLQWQVQYSARIPVWDDPLNQNLMQYDRIFEPIVANNMIYFGFNDQDKVVAMDINSGKEVWHYYVDGPVRLPLASDNGKIYFTCDDGNCYCLDALTGSLVWKVDLAPAGNKLLGNKRLISMWPARGGIVIKDNIVYTAASIFPMMGTFIYAINAGTGELIWKNESTGSNYILQPHKSPAFADIAPQGGFAISNDKLLVAGGRTVPAAFDLKTGKELYYNLAIYGNTGGAFTCCNNRVFFNQARERKTVMYDAVSGNEIDRESGEYPVVDGDTVYFSGKTIRAALLNENSKLTRLWEIDIPARKDLIKAGDMLFAADSNLITVIRINTDVPQKILQIKSDKTIERLLASHGKLIAVSDDGAIMVYGDTPVKDIPIHKNSGKQIHVNSSLAEEIIKSININSGYAIILGTKDPEFLQSLISNTNLSVVAFDHNPERITQMREYFDELGIKADRLCFLQYNQEQYFLPKYFASLTIVNDPAYLKGFNKEIITGLYESTRPYDGKLWFKLNGKEQKQFLKIIPGLKLYGAEVRNESTNTIISRTGALKGAADWTHNYGNISNTVKSDDEAVKAPLGILWFGGSSNMDVLPRHGHGPGEQIIDGRLIIQGINCISARDVYTGRVIWKKEIENLDEDNYMVYYDETYFKNQAHIPGANSRGTNFIATKEFVYVIEGNNCLLIDIKTGELTKTINTADESTTKLGYIGVYKNFLILGNNFSEFPEIKTGDETGKEDKFDNYNLTASRELIILDRFSGSKLWEITARHGFIHNSVIAGDNILFCLDKLPINLESKLKRRGDNIPGDSRLLYLDINTGKILHQETKNIFGSWLGYSVEHKLLLQASRPSRDMTNGENGTRMVMYKTKTKETLWDKAIRYNNPPIIFNDKIYSNGESYSLFTGEPLTEKDLITGEPVKWTFKREYGCGYVIASEHLLTFRSASAGFVNLDTREGVGSLGGFKAGCSANLIAANGVLNSPDYTRTCSCAYQNQTSLALIFMPWMNYWVESNYKWNGKCIKQLGLNLNAPGDRASTDNTLWLNFPEEAGIPNEIPVRMDTIDYFQIRKEPVSIKSENSPWISASAIGGIRSLEITLSTEPDVQETSYKVNLYFSELENKIAGERVFNIGIQGKKVMENVDIMKETGEKDKELIKSFTGIRAGKFLKINLEPIRGNTILSGIELIEEKM